MGQKRIALLGSTGSIGTQSLDVVRQFPERFKVEVLTAGNNAKLLIEQCLSFRPKVAVIANGAKYQEVKAALSHSGIEVLAGQEALCDVAAMPGTDIVLTALVGAAGLRPTLGAIKAGKDIALANKETLVVAGSLVTALAKKHGVKIYPIDSEHSAIFQCLVGEAGNPPEKIILTASGGPFRGKDTAFLSTVSKADALRHPNWAMGAKITIDSATLMNKGLEVIEAKWLFGVEAPDIEVVVHPQSVIHSMVQFADGSIKAQMGLPDMKLPILYALSYPERPKTSFERFSFSRYPNLSFEQPDKATFRNLQLAYDALGQSGNMPCVLNAANEVAVARFLGGEIRFLDIFALNEACMEKASFISEPGFDDFIFSDSEARRLASELLP